MLGRLYLNLLLGLLAADLFAQSPTPPPTRSTPAPSTAVSPTASPSPSDLLGSLSAADLQAAIGFLKSNFADPDAVNETELNRATLQGLMVRLGRGLLLTPDKSSGTEEHPAPFYGELFEGHVGYLRPGSLTNENLQALDKKLAEFGKKPDALVIDLRATSTNDFTVASDFAKRFSPKGKMLFAMRKAGKQEKTFNSDRDPTYSGLIVLLADGETAGGGETIAAALRFYDKALIIGQLTAGRAVEYSDFPLPSGKVLKVAVLEAVSPDGHTLYPEGIKPDLPVEMSMTDKRQVFQMSAEKGLAPFVYETERPHLNEAALIAGTNPELESAEQRRARGSDRLLHDAVLQRALDLITSLEIYQKR